MATEDILIRYRADVSQLESDINKVIQSQEELTQATQQNTQAQQKAVTSAEFAAKKRAQLLEQEQQKLIKLRDAQKLAFDPKVIDKYNSQIAESQKRIELLGGSAEKSKNIFANFSNQAIDQFKGIALAAAGAFSIQSIIAFSQNAFNAFLQAESAANKLKFSIVDIGGATEAAYDRLIKQSNELQAITVFGDDDIQNAQAALANYGLAADQIEALIPKLLDFATVTGSDLQTAVSQIGTGLEGAGREFKKYGIEVDAAKSRQENLNVILQGFEKFAGNAANAANTISGRYKQQQNVINDLEETIGERLAPSFLKIQTFALKALEVVTRLFGAKQQTDVQKTTANLREQQSEFNILADTLKKSNLSTETRKNLVDQLNTQFGEYLPNLLSEKSTLEDIEKAQKAVNTQIEGRVLLVALEERIANALKNAAAGQAIVTNSTKELTAAQKDLGDNAAAVANRVNRANVLIGTGEALITNTKDTVQGLKDEYEELKKKLGIVTQSTKTSTDATGNSAKALDDAKKAAEAFAKMLADLDAEIAKVSADLEKRKIEIISADSQQEQIDRVKALADLNEQAIKDEIKGKIKLVEEDANLSDKQKADIIAKYEELKAKRLELAQFNEQNELNIISKQQADRIEAAYAQIDALDLEKALTIQADKVETANEAVAKSFEDLGQAVSKEDFATAKEAATLRTKTLNQELENEKNLRDTQIKANRDAELAKVKDGEAGAIERQAINDKYDLQLENNKKETNKRIAKNNKELNNTITEEDRRATEARIAQTFEILSATQSVLNEINGLFKAASDKRIAEIEAERDAQLESIDAQLEKNKEFLEERKISDEEFAANEAALQEEKVRVEKEAQKKIREEKKKQAILDKTAALFDIALNTAVAVSKVIAQTGVVSPALIPLIIAQGAIQAAAVLAQPIPYRKGSKNTGPKDHMARVGEEGEEIVFMPSGSKVLPARQTKRYGEVIDAMFDNRLDDYIQRNYITPALMAQQNARDNQRSKSFAENIANSITYNQSGLTASDLEAQRKRGQYIRNVDELADAIAKRIPTRDIYRS